MCFPDVKNEITDFLLCSANFLPIDFPNYENLGLVIWWKPEWHFIDPLLTIGFCILVLYSTIGVFRSSFAVLLEETPGNINWQDVYDKVSAVPNVHDVHVRKVDHLPRFAQLCG